MLCSSTGLARAAAGNNRACVLEPLIARSLSSANEVVSHTHNAHLERARFCASTRARFPRFQPLPTDRDGSSVLATAPGLVYWLHAAIRFCRRREQVPTQVMEDTLIIYSDIYLVVRMKPRTASSTSWVSCS